MNKAPGGPQDPVEAAFIEFCNAWFAGEHPNLEEFCNRYPECGSELREKIENFLFVEQGLSDAGMRDEESASERSNKNDVTTGEILGDFKIYREIGRGGMATVYEAEQCSLNRKVALKILPAHLTISDQSVKKFYREAEAGGRQSHPGIVSIYAVGEHEGRHFIAQELIEGGRTLADKINELRSEKDFPSGYFRVVARLIAKVADALKHAHALGVIHRDVKPSNILLTEDEDPKVSDFGLAKVEDALSLSRSGEFAGTPYYMSPEQALSHRAKINHRTDIYSLGVTLYEMLTFHRPFEAKTSHEVLKEIVTQEPEDPRKKNPRVPRDLSTVCLKAMEKDPNHRYQSMAAFAEDLNRFLQGDVILARSAGPGTRVWKWAKRNPVVSAALGVALVATVVFSVVVPWIMYKNEQVIAQNEQDNAALLTIERDKAVLAQKEAEEQQKITEAEKKKAIIAQKEADAQKQHALTEKNKALNEMKKAEAIQLFLKDMLESAVPEAEGKDVKVVDILDQASKKMETAFLGQQEVEASLRATIGFTYQQLGQIDKAELHINKALQMRSSVLGEEHPDTINSLENMTGIHFDRGELDEAEALMRKVVTLRIKVMGENHKDTLNSKHNIACLLYGKGKLVEAENIHRKTLEGRKNILGEYHSETILSMTELANVLRDTGKLGEAEGFYKKAIDGIKGSSDEPDSVRLAIVMIQYARLKMIQGKFVEAEKVFRDVLDIHKKVYGKDHRHTLTSMYFLAAALQSNNKNREAISLLRETIELQRKALGEEHMDLFTAKSLLASLLSDEEKYAQAEETYREVLEYYRAKFGKEHPWTLIIMSNLASVLNDQGNYQEAELLHRASLEGKIHILGEEHPETICGRNNLAITLTKMENFNEAESLFMDLLKTMAKVLGKEHPETLNNRHNLAANLVGQGKLDEAEHIFRDVLADKKRVLGEKHPSFLNTKLHLGNLLYEQAKYTQAEPLFREVMNSNIMIIGAEHRETLKSMYLLALTLHKLEKQEEAESLLRKVVATQITCYGEEHPNTMANRLRLVTVLLSLQKYEEAEFIINSVHDQIISNTDKYNNLGVDDVLEYYIALYKKWDKPDKVMEYQNQLNSIGKKTRDT